MKSLLTILLIGSLLSGAVIGLLTMSQHGDCVASYAAGMTCPQFNILAYVGLHVSFLNSFSEAFLVMVLSALFGLAIFISFIFYSNNSYLKENSGESISEFNNAGKRKQIRWLSLFETSPTIA